MRSTKKHKSPRCVRLIALALALLISAPMLASCKTRAVPAGKLALTAVGTVGDKEVLYEELYYLCSNYLPALKEKHGDNTDALRAELKETVYRNITANYAILSLCEEMGVELDEKTLDAAVQAQIDTTVSENASNSRSEYRELLRSMGMTDHYMRNTIRVDLLYSELPEKYARAGLIPSSDEGIVQYVMENFYHTQHVVYLIEDGESREEDLKKAEQIVSKLDSGESMTSLIKYSEDFFGGDYYSAEGTMDKAYETAALALEIGEHSAVVESTGVSNIDGSTVPCFYVIKRLALDEEYIKSKLDSFYDKISDSITGKKLDERRAQLSFEPNSFCESLDLCALEYPKDGFDFFVLGATALCVVGIAGIGTGVFFISRHIHKKRLAERRRSGH